MSAKCGMDIQEILLKRQQLRGDLEALRSSPEAFNGVNVAAKVIKYSFVAWIFIRQVLPAKKTIPRLLLSAAGSKMLGAFLPARLFKFVRFLS